MTNPRFGINKTDQKMDHMFDELIDKYHYGELSKGELVLFNSKLETSSELGQEFDFYLKMKEYLLDDSLERFKESLLSIMYCDVNGNTFTSQ